MSNSNIKWNPGWEDELSNAVRAKLQPHFDRQVQDIACRVNAEMAGQPVNDVLAALRTQIRQAGMVPDETGLRATAEAISNRTLVV